MNLYQELARSLISVSSQTEETIHAVFCFDKDLAMFKGHFPNDPILPGILQFEMVKLALEKALDTFFSIGSINKSKFSGPIHPGETVEITIHVNQEQERLKARAVLKTEKTTAGKINLIVLKNRQANRPDPERNAGYPKDAS
ncbi:MAG TPA: hypothetical protein VJ936_05795 [Desulfobacteraceae bacterium]|nr:hypothetical protein [Desulfobacteraceae bacterium]